MDPLAPLTELFEHRWYPYILLTLSKGPLPFSAIADTIRSSGQSASRARLDDSVLSRNLTALHELNLVQPLGTGRERRWALTEQAGPTVTTLQRVITVLETEAAAPAPARAGEPPAQSATVPATTQPGSAAISSQVDTERPSVARIYDYLLGGCNNFEVDRELAARSLQADPDLLWKTRVMRDFLGRVVRYLLSVGVRQFLDIGSGLPTVGNVHEIVAAAKIPAKIVYVDIDPVAVAHTRHILGSHPHATILQQDARDTEAIVTQAGTLLDFTQPVAVLLLLVLNAIPDADDPHAIVRRLRERLAPGSYLAISHGTADSAPAVMHRAEDLSRRTPTPLTMRTRAQVQAFLQGLDLVEPGVVWAPQWRPDPATDPVPNPQRSCGYVALGRVTG